MKLHTPGQQADWNLIKVKDRNQWQRLASVSSGILTASNLISVAGLVLVVIGLFEIAYGNYISGSVLIAIGRLFDVLDGYVAELTKTKSPLGEIIDTTIDKIEIFTALIAIYITDILSSWILLTMLLVSLWISLAALLARHRQIDLHPTLGGKLATAAVWISLILFLFSKSFDQSSNWALSLAYGFFGLFIAFGLITALKYSRKIIYVGPVTADKLNRFDSFGVILNPKSSNANRTTKQIQEIKKILPKKLHIINTSQTPGKLEKDIRTWLQNNNKHPLIMIGGGDGTVHEVLNYLISLGEIAKNAVVLPIWGGNANDLAYMLNGPLYKKKIFKVLERGQIINMKPLKISVEHKTKTTVRYAASYASFGASAYVAQHLDQRVHYKKNWFFSSPLGLAAKEIWGVTDAFKKAPEFKAEINGQMVTIFEEAFMNGPRIAKINTIPLKLTDQAYYHAHQPNKHPLLSRRIIQVLTGQKFGKVTDKPTVFVLKETTVGQFDGEVQKIKKGSKITVSLASRSIKALSIKHLDDQ